MEFLRIGIIGTILILGLAFLISSIIIYIKKHK